MLCELVDKAPSKCGADAALVSPMICQTTLWSGLPCVIAALRDARTLQPVLVGEAPGPWVLVAGMHCKPARTYDVICQTYEEWLCCWCDRG